MTSKADLHFACTPGGAIATGARRLAILLLALGLLLLVAAVFSWSGGRLFPGLLALLVAGVVGLAWRMSNDLRPRRLRFENQTLIIETASRRIPFAISEATVRPLSDQEIRHLEVLASVGGFVVGTGGFDSRHLGEFDLYASDFNHALLVQSLDGRLVVTPDRRDAFIDTFRQLATSPPATIPGP